MVLFALSSHHFPPTRYPLPCPCVCSRPDCCTCGACCIPPQRKCHRAIELHNGTNIQVCPVKHGNPHREGNIIKIGGLFFVIQGLLFLVYLVAMVFLILSVSEEPISGVVILIFGIPITVAYLLLALIAHLLEQIYSNVWKSEEE